MHYIRNRNGRSSLVIYNLAINIKLGFSFRLQKDDTSLKKFSKIDLQCFASLWDVSLNKDQDLITVRCKTNVQQSSQGLKAFAMGLEAEQHLVLRYINIYTANIYLK